METISKSIYYNVYLFERGISDLNVQKNNRELEVMTQECILTAIRESIPTEAIIRAYMDESMEEEEEVIIEPIEEEEDLEEKKKEDQKKDQKNENGDDVDENGEKKVEELPVEELPATLGVDNLDNEKTVTRLTFNDTDAASDGSTIEAPKTIERLEEIGTMRNEERKQMEEDDDDDLGDSPIKIHMDEEVKLDDIFDLDKPMVDNDVVVLDGVEEL